MIRVRDTLIPAHQIKAVQLLYDGSKDSYLLYIAADLPQVFSVVNHGQGEQELEQILRQYNEVIYG